MMVPPSASGNSSHTPCKPLRASKRLPGSSRAFKVSESLVGLCGDSCVVIENPSCGHFWQLTCAAFEWVTCVAPIDVVGGNLVLVSVPAVMTVMT
jgi:hypothetical protein